MANPVEPPEISIRDRWQIRHGKNLGWLAGSAALALGLWWGAIILFRPQPYVLPSPEEVLLRLWTDRAILLTNGVSTGAETIIGLVFGILVGVPLGISIVASRVIQRLVYPIVVAFNAIPKVAMAPLFVVWLGYGFVPRVLITTSIAFFPILVATISGLMSIDPDYLRLAKVMHAKEHNVFLHMRLPNALPSIFSGIKVGTSLAVIGAIIGEFVASDQGWGYLLLQATGTLDTPIMFAIITLLAVFATVLFAAVAWSEQFFVSWHASQRVSQ